eukprot:m.62813 g.62813  ORF g.62813 m.62813 type:complete len:186 (+) comp11416_c0_seq2:3-560(+)
MCACVCVLLMFVDCTHSQQRDMACFIREAEVMCGLKHSNIVRLEGVCLQEQPWLIVQELVLYGDLDYVLRAGKARGVAITLREVLIFAEQLCDAVAFVHAKGYLHNDIAARNVLLGSHNEVKLADFGMARRLKDGATSVVLKDVPMVRKRCVLAHVHITVAYSNIHSHVHRCRHVGCRRRCWRSE